MLVEGIEQKLVLEGIGGDFYGCFGYDVSAVLIQASTWCTCVVNVAQYATCCKLLCVSNVMRY